MSSSFSTPSPLATAIMHSSLRENCRRLSPADGGPLDHAQTIIMPDGIIPDSQAGISHFARNSRYFWAIARVAESRDHDARAGVAPNGYT